MDRAEYDKGYKEAIEKIKETLKSAGSGDMNSNSGNSNSGDNNSSNNSGLDTNIIPQNNNGALSKKAADKIGDQQGGHSGQQGQSGAGSSGINIGVPSTPRSGDQGGSMNQSANQTPGGSQKSQSSKQARSSEVGKLGGGFIDQKTGAKLAEEAGYTDRESGANTNQNMGDKWGKIARQVAEKIGIGSGKGSGLLTAIESIYKPKVNWKAALKSITGYALSNKDYEEKWGNKKWMMRGELKKYERNTENNLSKVFFLIDTSGSVGMKQLQIMISEAAAIVKQKQVSEVTFISYGDGVVWAENLKTNGKFTNTDLKRLKLGDGGGTDFSQTCDEIGKAIKAGYINYDGKKHPFKMTGIKKADLVVVFTDGDTISLVKEKPSWMKNVAFLICANRQTEHPNFGKEIAITPDDVN